ncbi:hypothetical protein GCM10028818_58850 [Spirosoma horti]
MKGVVFRDYDLNGVRSDTLPIELGVAGVMVRAFVDLNKVPIQTTTDAQGNYAFSAVDVPAGMPVRIEFSNLPTGDYNGPSGSGSGTSVQFTKAPAVNVNVGINYPADYCQPKGVRLVVPCYVNGNTQITTDANGNPVPDDKQAAKADVLVDIAYQASGVAGASNFPPVHLASGSQTGAVWALAYQRRSKKMFSAAVVKRHMSFGPLGSGGMYATDMTTQTTSNFLDVRTLGIDTGDDPHSGLFGDKTLTSTDPGAMHAVGRQSFGGMDMSEDDKTIYFINLNDRKLYSIFVNSPAVTPSSSGAVKSWSIPDPGCSNGDFRPWALKVYHGKIYVGVVCSAETSQLQTDLKATIYRFDPNEATPTFEEVLSFPLDFRRGSADLTTDPLNPDNTCAKYDHWLPWTDAWPTPCGLGNTPNFVMYPQPILTDLDFDDDGSMLIGFMDRFGSLASVANHDPQGNGFYDGFTAGDLLRAYATNGTYELEKNGKSGPLTGSGVGNGEGPVDASNVGGEFFGNDKWFFVDHIAHAEVTNGSLSFIPGYSEIFTSAFDPISNVYQSGGLKVFNSKTGYTNRDYVLFTLEGVPGSFGKAGGLGDIKALCDAASVEIGNRVWFDDNRDGIQDAYEPGIDGIVLTLHDMENGGSLIATQTSHDGGQFYFNNSTVPGGLQYDHKYEIRMDTLQLSTLDITLAGAKPLASAGGRLAARKGIASLQRYYTVSPANRGGFTDADLRDSDANLIGGSAVIAVTSLNAGQNDFTNDLAIYSCPEVKNEKDTISLCPGIKLDSIAAVGTYLCRVDSVRFVSFSSPQSGTAMYGSGGVVLGTVSPNAATGRAVLMNPLTNTSSGSSNQYIYAIIYPMPENPACRQSSVTVIRLLPSLVTQTTGGILTCSQPAVTLAGVAQHGDGSPAAQASYSWIGPNGFTALIQNPVVSVAGTYTLTVSDPACPASFTTATAEVTSNTVVPPLSTSVVAKLCPTCTATISASAPGASLIWTGPNGFAAVGAQADVQLDGVYSVTATGSNGCFATAQVSVVPSFCPSLSNAVASVSLCSGSQLDSLVSGSQYLSAGESVRFVSFSSPQSGTAMYGSGGVVLGTVLPNATTGRAVLLNPTLTTTNTTGGVLSQYIYAIVFPTPALVACRPSAQTIIQIAPSLVAKPMDGVLTCSQPSVTLAGVAQYGDGSPAAQATYSWSGPNGFTALIQNPVVSVAGTYTLTVSDPACPANQTAALAVVLADTTQPELTAFGAALACVGCSATLFAEAPGATLHWTGPNGFTSTEAEPVVTIPGEYTVTAIGISGCRVSSTVDLLPVDRDPCADSRPSCIPFTISRIK